MASLNRIILIGRLVRDPEHRATPTGLSVVKMCIAVDRVPGKEGQKATDFIDIVAFDRLAENCRTALSKGRLVAVEGRLQIREYTTQDGQKRRAAEVIANKVQFLDRPKESPLMRDSAAQERRSLEEGGPVEEDLPLSESSFSDSSGES